MTAGSGDALQIVTGADEGFAPGVIVTVASALAWLPPGRQAVVHVLDGGLAARTRRTIESVTQRMHPGTRTVFHPVEIQKFAGFNPGLGNSRMYYARLHIGSFVSAERAIYLDADMVVLSDLTSLWEADMAGNTALAVPDLKIPVLRSDCPWPLSDAEGAEPYFNSGMLLMDLKSWRRQNAEARAFELAAESGERCRLHDQTVINYVLRGRIGTLPAQWNWQSEKLPGDGGVHVIHFTTRKKPWLHRGPGVRFRIWRAFYEFATGPSWPLFLRKNALSGLSFSIMESLLVRIDPLRDGYVGFQRYLLQKTADPQKRRHFSGTIAYFTTGPGGGRSPAIKAGEDAFVATTRANLRNRVARKADSGKS